jgi:hypothetical protein
MKRCPQCLFLYPDSDEYCDFDKTPLEVVDDSALEAATRPAKRRSLLPIAAVIGVILGVLAFATYYALSYKTRKAAAAVEPATQSAPQFLPSPVATPSPSPESSPSPSPSASASPKTAANSVSTAHSRATSDPVSTSGPGMGNRQGGKPVIMLASGGKIEADEVWRTKDGVWYRRNGMVTLLKRAQVKAIVTQ